MDHQHHDCCHCCQLERQAGNHQCSLHYKALALAIFKLEKQAGLPFQDWFLSSVNFPSVKSELAGLLLSQDNFKTSWEGVLRTINKDEFATVFQQWYECSYECIQIGDDHFEKSWEINTFLTLIFVLLLKYSSLILVSPLSSCHWKNFCFGQDGGQTHFNDNLSDCDLKENCFKEFSPSSPAMYIFLRFYNLVWNWLNYLSVRLNTEFSPVPSTKIYSE